MIHCNYRVVSQEIADVAPFIVLCDHTLKEMALFSSFFYIPWSTVENYEFFEWLIFVAEGKVLLLIFVGGGVERNFEAVTEKTNAFV